MSFVVTGLVTIGLVILFNKMVVTPFNDEKLIFVVPMVEEIAKTGSAIFLGSPVLLNHVFFGTVEALDDLWRSNKKSAPAALASFVGHLIFGIFALLGMNLFGHFLGGILLSYTIHLGWNLFVIKLKKPD